MGDPVSSTLLAGGSAIAQGIGGRKAAKQQARAGEQAYNTQAASQQRLDELMSPYTEAGQTGLNELMATLGVGDQKSTYQNPLLQQIQQQTLQSMSNRSAATGRNSSSDMASLTAQSMLQPAYQMQQQRIGQLQGLSGMGLNAASQLGMGNAQIANNMAGSQVNIGNAQAAGTTAMYGALAGGMNQMAGFAGMGGGNPMASFGGMGGGAGQTMYQPTTPGFSNGIFNQQGMNNSYGFLGGAPL